MKSSTRRKSKKPCSSMYLAGPMEWAPNAGRSWRLRYKQEFSKLGIDCIIPEFEEKYITNQQELNQLKKINQTKYIECMRQLIKLDLQFVVSVDLVVVRWEGERMSGTIGEVQEAHLKGTPVYLVTSKEFEEIPGWFLACFDKIFPSLKDLTEHIKTHHL